jgi:hypothetical protein
VSLERRWDAIVQFLAALDGVRVQDVRGKLRWSVGNRLVARQVDESTLLIRTDFAPREDLLDRYPTTFSMRPNLEAHMKVLADVAHGDIAAICAALRAAWTMQRRAAS